MSIPVPNYTQIPNVIFDHWMKVLNPSEFTILMCLCRKTFGWHKASDRISKNQLMKATGLSKNTIQSSLESLEAHRLLIRIQSKNEYGFEPNEYRLNIHKPEDVFLEENGQNLGGDGSTNDPGVGQPMTQGVGQSLTPQKKDSTKERLTKEKTPPNPLKGDVCVQSYGSFVKLSKRDYDALVATHTEPQLLQVIEELNDYIASKGVKYKDFAATLRNWFRNRKRPFGSHNAKYPSTPPGPTSGIGRPPGQRGARDEFGNLIPTGKEGMF